MFFPIHLSFILIFYFYCFHDVFLVVLNCLEAIRMQDSDLPTNAGVNGGGEAPGPDLTPSGFWLNP